MNLAPKVVLGVAAHADDLDFGAGGTLAAFAAAGAAVHYLLLTDGGKGSSNGIDPEEFAATRLAEQQAACAAIGGSSVRSLGYGDGELEVTPGLKRDIVKVIRELQPEVVITFNPAELFTARYGQITHNDHRVAGQATLDAVYPLARDSQALPELIEEGYQPHKVETVLMMSFENHNYYVDIESTLAVKQQAFAAHVSQIKDPAVVAKKIEQFALDTGQAAGCRYAEGFTRVDIAV